MITKERIKVRPWLKCCNDCQGPGKCRSKRGAGHWSTLVKYIPAHKFDPKRYRKA